jgi:hypothetical protein
MRIGSVVSLDSADWCHRTCHECSDRRLRLPTANALAEQHEPLVVMAARSFVTGPSVGYVHSMPKARPETPVPQTKKSEQFAHLAEGTLVSAPKKERVEARSRERARERSVSDD